MATPVTPAVAQLLGPAGRQETLEKIGLPSVVAKLATMMGPDPTTPYAFGALKFLDLAMRRTAPLARVRMAKVLGDIGDTLPDRLWQFLEQHPQVVSMAHAPRIPRPPGWPSQPTGRVVFPQVGSTEPVLVQINRRAHDRPAALAHELAAAATGLAGKQNQFLPGLTESYLGALPLHQRYGPKTMDAALFPTLFDQPSWVRIHRLDDTLQALRDWFPTPTVGIGR